MCIPGQLLPEERDATHSLTAGARLTETTGGGGVYKIESGTLSNYKNLSERLLDQIDDICN